MRFFNVLIDRQKLKHGVIPKFDPGPAIVCTLNSDNNLRIPIFLRLFRQHQRPKKRIVRVERKYGGTLEQWAEDCVKFTWLHAGSTLEYPTSAIQRCHHEFDVCRSCTATHISVSLESSDAEHITCPQCHRVLSYDEVRSLAKLKRLKRSLTIDTSEM